MLIFLDLEASALIDGYPTEVGWVRHPDHASYSSLVRPDTDWIGRLNWDPAAEAVTGIKQSDLAENGRDRAVVAAELIRDLNGHHVFVDGGVTDQRWLNLLTAPAVISLEDFHGLLATAAYRGGWQDLSGAEALERAITDATRGRRIHRALDDAEALLIAFEIALGGPKAPAGIHR